MRDLLDRLRALVSRDEGPSLAERERVTAHALAVLARCGSRTETYAVRARWTGRLDVHRPPHAAPGAPALVFFHGGGWVEGRREQAAGMLVPFLEWGLVAVNVSYRLAHEAPAPAAVDDARDAVRWVRANAAALGVDGSRLLLGGQSAGGHLALLTALAPGAAGGPVAAVVNWFGVTDVADLLRGRNARDFARRWLAGSPDPERLARELSPLALVGPGAPPTFTVHRDRDPVVPYAHSERLHEALAQAGVVQRLVTLRGRRHGKLTDDERTIVRAELRDFLAARALVQDR